MIGAMSAANITTASEPATPDPETPESVTPDMAKAAARAANAALAARQVRHASGRWLTSERIPVLGQALVLSIQRYQHLHRRPPTWSDAVAGVDPALLAPLQQVPDGWPHKPALWRRELRQHLMTELKRTRWITYTPTPRSLHPGDQGRGWLRTTPTTAHPTNPATT